MKDETHQSEIFSKLDSFLFSLKSRKRSFQNLLRYYDCRMDEDSNRVILLMEFTEHLNLQDTVANYGYMDETKVKLVVFQIVNGLMTLAEHGYNHG